MPSGNNGYEELVLAGDVLESSAAWREADRKNDLTLTLKRLLLSDGEVRRALGLLRQGLVKPFRSPRAQVDDQTRFPELARFRALARLLAHQVYVHLADGQVASALDVTIDLLKFGYQVQRDTLIGGLVGVAIDAIGMKMLSTHLDQLSAKDCDRLRMLANQWMELPDPCVELMRRERDGLHTILKKYREQPDGLFGLLAEGYTDGENPAALARLEGVKRTAKDNPGSIGPLFDEVGRRLDAQFDRIDREMRKPVWERGSVDELPQDETPAGVIAGMLMPVTSQVSDRYAREQAQMQLLGVHAAVRRYRWEFSRLPASLAELNLGKMGVDPFSGKPFVYRTLDDAGYELYSIGPADRSEGAQPGARKPIR
jgi:hypothetical protein